MRRPGGSGSGGGLRRFFGWIIKGVLAFVILSVAIVGLYRFVPPPITLTMVGDALAGHGIDKSWMPLSRIDPNMARAAIAGEDSRFCSHNGFDMHAIETAYARNARGGRIRGDRRSASRLRKTSF